MEQPRNVQKKACERVPWRLPADLHLCNVISKLHLLDKGFVLLARVYLQPDGGDKKKPLEELSLFPLIHFTNETILPGTM